MRPQRVDRLLSNLGYCTRGGALSFIKKNQVLVEGERVLSLHAKALPSQVTINGEAIRSNEPLHLMFHKPKGVVCTRAKGEHRTVYDFLPEDYIKRRPLLSICGRLDKWVTGLVLLTQDGQLQHQIASPSRRGKQKLPKVYLVQSRNPLSGKEPELFASGTLKLRGEIYPCRPAKFEVVDQEQKMARITLYEGRYHQVRRMMAAIGNGVPLSIKRESIGPIQLGDLPEGKWRPLKREELKVLVEASYPSLPEREERYNNDDDNEDTDFDDEDEGNGSEDDEHAYRNDEEEINEELERKPRYNKNKANNEKDDLPYHLKERSQA
ncbi:Pseudouridine synthase [Balamuthia mandrillaris]